MKKGLALLITAAALVGCSPQQEGSDQGSQRSSRGTATNEASGAGMSSNSMQNGQSSGDHNAPSATDTNKAQ